MSDQDEMDLAKLMEQAGKENEEISGDEDEFSDNDAGKNDDGEEEQDKSEDDDTVNA